MAALYCAEAKKSMFTEIFEIFSVLKDFVTLLINFSSQLYDLSPTFS